MHLTPNEKKALIFLSNNEGASFEELGDHMDAWESYARQLVKSLKDKKLVTKKPYVPRSIRLTQKGREAI